MNLEQLQKLKLLDNGYGIIKELIDKNDVTINQTLSLFSCLKKEDTMINNFEFIINYYDDIVKNEKDINKRELIFLDVKAIINNSFFLGDCERIQLLNLFRESGYSYTYYRILSDTYINWNDIDKLKPFIQNVKARSAVDFIIPLTKYRDLNELTDILNNYNINKNCYNSKLAKYRTHEEVCPLVDLYNKSTILFNSSEIEKKEFNKKDYLYKILMNDKILFKRTGEQHLNLMKYFIEYPNEKMYNIIINNNVLLNRRYDEQEMLIKELIRLGFDQKAFEMSLRSDFNKYSVHELLKMIRMSVENVNVPIYEYINKNNNIPFCELYNSIISKFNIPVTIASLIDYYEFNNKKECISKIEEILLDNNVHSFNSSTKILLKTKSEK